MIRKRIAIVAGVLAGLIALSAAGCGGGGGGGSAKSGTLQIWLGGDLTQATPGSPFKDWVDLQIKRFQKQNPGWKVETTLLPFDNAQNAAKLQAAFGSHKVPDLMNLYAGQFTNTYADALSSLTSNISQQKGLFQSIPENIWSLDCTNYDCQGGKGTILGVPWNSGAYYLYYNKALMSKAGISKPPATFDELFADCKKLNAKGITPVSMGANDGYDTSNVFTSNLVSTLGTNDLQGILSGKIPYDDPKVVSALDPVLKLTDSSTGCTSPDALGEDQLKGTNSFKAGTAAMTPYFGLELSAFQKALGSKLGLARLPVSGNGPLLNVANGYAGNPFDGWVIPKDSPNADVAWKFIQIASDASANQTSQRMMGLSPAITSVAQGLTDPLQKLAASLSGNPAIAELDQVMPGNVANYMYKQLALGQLGKQSAAETMHSVQTFAQSPVNQP